MVVLHAQCGCRLDDSTEGAQRKQKKEREKECTEEGEWGGVTKLREGKKRTSGRKETGWDAKWGVATC